LKEDNMKAVILTILSLVTLVSFIIFISSFGKELYHIILGGLGFVMFLFLLIALIKNYKANLFN